MKSNKKLLCLLFAVCVLFSQITVYANSGPAYWYSYPSSEVLLVDKNCPIKVEKENLLFDFSNTDKSHYIISGTVSASYEMLNDSKTDTDVTMAFPFVTSLQNFNSKEIEILADQKNTAFKIYIGDTVSSSVYNKDSNKDYVYDFNKIINNITKEDYKPTSFSKKDTLRCYKISVDLKQNERLNLAVDFNFNKEKTRIISENFNGYNYDNGDIKLSSWFDNNTKNNENSCLLYVIGDPLDFDISAFSDGDQKQSISKDKYAVTVEEKNIELKEMIQELLESKMNIKDHNAFETDDIYNLCLKTLDISLLKNNGITTAEDLYSIDRSERIFTLVYDVHFDALQKQNVTVKYKAHGIMDKTETVNPYFTFNYILNPAKNWADFKDLNIQIKTPEDHPYVINNNINLVKIEPNVYEAKLSSLPKEDLTFSLYEKEEITVNDKVAFKFDQFKKSLYMLLYFIPVLLLVAVLVTAAILYNQYRTKKENKNQ